MARLITSGFELGIVSTTNDGNPDGPVSSVTAVSSELTIVHGGSKSMKCDSGAGNVVATCQPLGYPLISAGSITIFQKFYLYLQDLPNLETGILSIFSSWNGQTDLTNAPRYLGINSSGFLCILSGSSLVNRGTATTLPLATGAWYRIEVSTTYTIVAATSATAVTNEIRVNDVAVAMSTLPYSQSANSGTPNVSAGGSLGWKTAPGANKILYVDDVAVNDSTGANQNTWPGEGKVVLLVPIADSAKGTGWTNDQASQTNLFNSVDNKPPIGIADTTAGGGTHQLRNATSNANSNYDATMNTYSSAGIGASDTITLIDPIINTGAPVTTSAKQGTVGVASNPTIANIALSSTGTAGAYWAGTAAGTFPTGWKWSHGTITYSPTVTLGTAPVMRVTQVTSSTRIAMVDFMGMYVEYVPGGTAYTESATIGSTTGVASTESLDSADSATIGTVSGISATDIQTPASPYVGERAAVTNDAGTGLTEVITIASDCTLGNTVILIFAARDTSSLGCSVADSRGNTWAFDAGPLNGSNDFIFIASTQQDGGTLLTGDTITITFGTAPGNDRLSLVEEFTNLVADQAANNNTNTSSSTANTGSTGATTQAREVAIAAFCLGLSSVAAVTVTSSVGNYNELNNIGPGSPADILPKQLYAEYLTLLSTGFQGDIINLSPNVNSSENAIVTYKISLSTNYVDSSSPSSKTTASSVDVAQYVDSSLVSSNTAISSTETRTIVDSATISSASSASASESAQLVDSSTVSSSTSISALEGKAYIDAQTVASTTAALSTEIEQAVDSNTVATITAITSLEAHELTDSATISSTTTPISSEAAQYVDSSVVAGTTSISSIEVVPLADANTISSLTSLTSVEQIIHQDSSIVSSATGISSSDVAAYVDQATISSLTALQSVDLSAYVDLATIASVTVPSSAEIAVYVDAFTISTKTTPQSIDVLVAIDANTVTSITSLSSTDIRTITDQQTITSLTTVLAVETAQFIEIALIESDTDVSSVEGHELFDISTVTTQSSVISSDVSPYVDTSTIATITSIQYVEFVPFVDLATISGVSTPISVDVANYVDSASLASKTTVSSVEQFLTPGFEAATIATKTTPSIVDVAAYIDHNTVSGVSTPSAGEISGYVDTGTTSTITKITSSEVLDTADAAILNTTTGITTTDVAAYLDTTTVLNTTTVLSSDFAPGNNVDTATLATTTSLTPVEVFEGKDAAEISTTTTLTSADVVGYVDALTPFSITSLLSTDTPAYVDTAVSLTTTYITYTEDFTGPTADVDSALITTTTTVSAVERGPVEIGEFNLVGIAYTRWATSSMTQKYNTVAYRRWNSVADFGDLEGVSSKKWKI